MEIQRIPVVSSNVASVGYDSQQRVLEVEFTGGGVYRYSDVPPEVFLDLMDAPSVGKHLNANIKGRYQHTKV